MKASDIIKYAISLAVAALLMYFSFKGVQWKQFWVDIMQCRWGFVLLGMGASLSAVVFRARRWRCLVRAFDPGIKPITTFNCVNIGYLANFAFPRIGEVVRCGFLSTRSRSDHAEDPSRAISFDKAVGTVLLSRTWDVIVVFLLIGVLLVCKWREFGVFFTKSLLRPVQEKFNVNLWVMLLALVMVLAGTSLCVWSLRNKSGLCAKIVDFIKGIGRGFASFAAMEGKGLFLLYTVLLWSMYWLMSMSVIWALPQLGGLGWVDAWFVCLAGSVAWMVPVPGGFGAYHFVVALALSSVYGLSWDTGMLYATLNHEAQAVMMVVLGFISYIYEVTKK